MALGPLNSIGPSTCFLSYARAASHLALACRGPAHDAEGARPLNASPPPSVGSLLHSPRCSAPTKHPPRVLPPVSSLSHGGQTPYAGVPRAASAFVTGKTPQCHLQHNANPSLPQHRPPHHGLVCC